MRVSKSYCYTDLSGNFVREYGKNYREENAQHDDDSDSYDQEPPYVDSDLLYRFHKAFLHGEDYAELSGIWEAQFAGHVSGSRNLSVFHPCAQ